MITFVVPVSKGRQEFLAGCVFSIQRFYALEEHEILVVEQLESEPFKLGQLRNIGFRESRGDILVFIDVDMRFIEIIPFRKMLEQYKKPFVAWKKIINVREGPIGVFEELNSPTRRGHGGCTAFTKDQYKKSCGHSNLLVGWGAEDDVLARRCYMGRLGNTLYHVFHPNSKNERLGKLGKSKQHNKIMMIGDRLRKKEEDSFIQTLWNSITIKDTPDMRHYLVSNIRVPENFAYMNLFKASESFADIL